MIRQGAIEEDFVPDVTLDQTKTRVASKRGQGFRAKKQPVEDGDLMTVIEEPL